jgi:hypothetical protein
MALDVALLLCPLTVASDIFTLRKDTAKTHCNNVRLNVLDIAPLAIYQAAFVGHWLIMGLKTDNSHVDVQLSKMEASIENIVSLTPVGNLAIN